MYCPSCGEEVTSGGYCWHCGGDLPDEVSDNIHAQERHDTDDVDVGIGTGTATEVSDGTTLAAVTHLLALFTWVVGPLVVLLVTDEEFVKENATNALNWQISFMLYSFISLLLILLIIGILTLALLVVLDFVFCVIAAVKAADGETWEHPLTIKFA